MIGIVLGLYLVVLVAMGVYSARRVKTEGDYLVAGRKLNTWVLGCTLPATQMSAGTAIGTVGYVYFYGYQYMWATVLLWFGWIIAAMGVARAMWRFGKKAGGMTIPDVIGARFYSKVARVLAAAMIIVGFMFEFTAQYAGAAAVLKVIFHTPYVWAVVVAGAVFIIYTILGGLFSIAYNDVIQMLVFAVGYTAAAFAAVSAAGGLTAINTKLMAANPQLLTVLGNNLMPASAVLGFGFMFLIYFISYPIDTMKFYAAVDEPTILRAISIGIAFQAIVFLAVAFIGVAGRALYPGLTGTAIDNVAPLVALHNLPPVVGALMMAAVLGAVMAVSSSIMLLVGSAFAHDIYVPFFNRNATPGKKLAISRIASILVGIASMLLALHPIGAVETIILIVGQFMAAAFGVVLLTGLTTRWANKEGAILAMIGGIVGTGVWFALGSPLGLIPIFPGLLMSMVGMAVGVRWGQPVPSSVQDLFFEDDRDLVPTSVGPAPVSPR